MNLKYEKYVKNYAFHNIVAHPLMQVLIWIGKEIWLILFTTKLCLNVVLKKKGQQIQNMMSQKLIDLFPVRNRKCQKAQKLNFLPINLLENF